jgi:hypothetical protein
VNCGGVCGMACLISRSLAAEREGKRVLEREEIRATFIGTEGWRIGQGINRIEEGEKIARAGSRA